MTRVRLTVALAMLMLAAATPAIAQERGGKGTTEVRAGFDLTWLPDPRDGGEGTSAVNWRTTVQRFVTDRLAIGPTVGANKGFFGETTGFYGGRATYHLGPMNRNWVPFVDFSSAKSFGGEHDPWDIQLQGGLKLYAGQSGAFFLLGPYYYRAFYDEAATGIKSFNSFGVVWDVGIAF